MSRKTELFEYELGFIKNENIKNLGMELIEIMPEYFFNMPASTTGKYHPQYALGDGGLLRHTKAAVRIAVELFHIETFDFTEDEKDLIVLALILHDGWKTGVMFAKYTAFDHPMIASKVLSETSREYPEDSDNQKHIEFICKCIETHMGQWNSDRYTGKFMEKPTDKYQNFVHMCDYLASRKCLELNFDAEVKR